MVIILVIPKDVWYELYKLRSNNLLLQDWR